MELSVYKKIALISIITLLVVFSTSLRIALADIESQAVDPSGDVASLPPGATLSAPFTQGMLDLLTVSVEDNGTHKIISVETAEPLTPEALSNQRLTMTLSLDVDGDGVGDLQLTAGGLAALLGGEYYLYVVSNGQTITFSGIEYSGNTVLFPVPKSQLSQTIADSTWVPEIGPDTGSQIVVTTDTGYFMDSLNNAQLSTLPTTTTSTTTTTTTTATNTTTTTTPPSPVSGEILFQLTDPSDDASILMGTPPSWLDTKMADILEVTISDDGENYIVSVKLNTQINDTFLLQYTPDTAPISYSLELEIYVPETGEVFKITNKYLAHEPTALIIDLTQYMSIQGDTVTYTIPKTMLPSNLIGTWSVDIDYSGGNLVYLPSLVTVTDDLTNGEILVDLGSSITTTYQPPTTTTTTTTTVSGTCGSPVSMVVALSSQITIVMGDGTEINVQPGGGPVQIDLSKGLQSITFIVPVSNIPNQTSIEYLSGTLIIPEASMFLGEAFEATPVQQGDNYIFTFELNLPGMIASMIPGTLQATINLYVDDNYNCIEYADIPIQVVLQGKGMGMTTTTTTTTPGEEGFTVDPRQETPTNPAQSVDFNVKNIEIYRYQEEGTDYFGMYAEATIEAPGAKDIWIGYVVEYTDGTEDYGVMLKLSDAPLFNGSYLNGINFKYRITMSGKEFGVLLQFVPTSPGDYSNAVFKIVSYSPITQQEEQPVKEGKEIDKMYIVVRAFSDDQHTQWNQKIKEIQYSYKEQPFPQDYKDMIKGVSETTTQTVITMPTTTSTTTTTKTTQTTTPQTTTTQTQTPTQTSPTETTSPTQTEGTETTTGGGGIGAGAIVAVVAIIIVAGAAYVFMFRK